MPSLTSPTPAVIARAKRAAKRLTRETSLTHSQALEQEAVRLGFRSWHDLISRAATRPSLVPVNPELPAGFDHTPNEDRPTSQLDMWWDRLFAQTRSDGSYDVYCLNGGAWDRPTWLASSKNLTEAVELATHKQARYVSFRQKPYANLEEDGTFSVVEPPQRPDRPMRVLAAHLAAAAAQQFLASAACSAQTPGDAV